MRATISRWSGKKILFIHPGWEQAPLLKVCVEAGCTIYATCDENPEESFIAGFLKCDVSDLVAISTYARSISVEAVIADQCDRSHFAQSYICEVLNLPGPSIQSAQLSSNKALQRQRLKDLGVETPNFSVCHFLSDVRQFAKDFGFPFVLKPIDNRGSIGVSIIKDFNDVEHSYFSAIMSSPSRACIAESFINGREYSVDGGFFGGEHYVLAIGQKRHLSQSLPVAIEICYRNEFDSAVFRSISEFVSEAVTALGYRYGLTHTEIILDQEGQMWIVEAANRGGGCLTSEVLVPAVSGVDVNSFLLDEALGAKFQYLAHSAKQEVSLSFITLDPGTICKISGWDKVLMQPQVIHGRLACAVGDKVVRITNDGDRHGFLIHVVGEKTFEELIAPLSVEYEG